MLPLHVIALLVSVFLLALAFHPRVRGIFRRNAFTYLGAGIAAAITVAMVIYPDAAYDSAVDGLKLWWEVVFPALLPFFIGSEILMGLGVVHFMGVLLEPFMRPLFNVPGVGSFVMAMGLASGYPLGSILTAKLRRDGLCSRAEAERLMSFTNTADPLFMTGAVAVGMFHDIWVGPVIVTAHYVSAVMVGLILGVFGRGRDASAPLEATRGNIVARAFRAMSQARRKDGRPFGKIMGDAVKESVNSLLMIGGFIILFSVVVRILEMVGVVSAVSSAFTLALEPLGWNVSTVPALTSGLFEITMGTQVASQAHAPLVARVMAASAVIAWSGLSVHAQVAAVTQGTDIRMGVYIGARVLHAVLAAVFTAFIMGPGQSAIARVVPALSRGYSPALAPAFAPSVGAMSLAQWAQRLHYFGLRFGCCCLLLLLGSFILSAIRLPAFTVACVRRSTVRPPRRPSGTPPGRRPS